MSILYEIFPFIIIAVSLLITMHFVLENEARWKAFPFAMFIFITLVLICWEIYKTEANFNRQKNDNMQPVVEKLDEILQLMKSEPKAVMPSPPLKTKKPKPSAAPREKIKKQSSFPPSSIAPFSDEELAERLAPDEGLAGRLASAEQKLERLQKKHWNILVEKKKQAQDLTSLQKENEGLRLALSTAPSYKTYSKPVKSPKRIKPATLPKTDEASPPVSPSQAKLPSQPKTHTVSADHRFARRLCLHGKKTAHMPFSQTMIKLLKISETGEKADFDITLPNAYVHRMADMEEGTRRLFESNRKAYFLELVQLQTGCADVAVDERKQVTLR